MTAPAFTADLGNWSSAWIAHDPAVRAVITDGSQGIAKPTDRHAERYRDAMLQWIAHSSTLDWSGCGTKAQWAMTNGIHDALVQQVAHVHAKHTRLVAFRDDYRFYQDVLAPYPHTILTWDQLDHMPLGAYVLVSWPNHRGLLDHSLDQLIEVCRARDCRIFLDCAFYGTIAQGRCDTGDPVFDAVAFSVSKAFQAGSLRAGLVWGDDLAATLTVPLRQEYLVYNANSARTAAMLLENFAADWVPKRYVPLQQEWCSEHGLLAADICMFALDSSPAHAALRRDGSNHVRICLSNWIAQKLYGAR